MKEWVGKLNEIAKEHKIILLSYPQQVLPDGFYLSTSSLVLRSVSAVDKEKSLRFQVIKSRE